MGWQTQLAIDTDIQLSPEEFQQFVDLGDQFELEVQQQLLEQQQQQQQQQHTFTSIRQGPDRSPIADTHIYICIYA